MLEARAFKGPKGVLVKLDIILFAPPPDSEKHVCACHEINDPNLGACRFGARLA